MSHLMDAHGNGRPEDHIPNRDLITRSLAKEIASKTQPILNRIHRAQRYRYGAKLEESVYEVLRLSIEAPRAKTITKCAALVDAIDFLHDILHIGVNHKIIREGFIASIMQPKKDDHPGGELWQLSLLAKTMLKNAKSKRKG